MSDMPLLNCSTSIDVEKSLGEIQKCLREHGALAVLTEYDDQGYVTALSFKINLQGQDMGFRLPTDWRPVLEIMQQQKKTKTGTRTRYGQPKKNLADENQQQAMRVAWRITKDWIEAQMAIVETKMVTLPQVFLPYAVTKSGKTVYEKILAGEDGMKLLN